MARIFVGNLSYFTTPADLRSVFEPFGKVASVRIPHDQSHDGFHGFAFVEMPVSAQAQDAAAFLNDSKLDGSVLYVRVMCK